MRIGHQSESEGEEQRPVGSHLLDDLVALYILQVGDETDLRRDAARRLAIVHRQASEDNMN